MTNGAKRTRTRRDLWLLGGTAVVLLALVIAVVISRIGSDDQDHAAPARSGASDAAKTYGPLGDLSRREPDDRRALGPVDAPVTMVVFSDFRCPFCAEYSREIEPKLIDRYVDSGQLRIEWRDQPLFGEQSELAAQAGWAAAAQDRFWPFVHEVYRDAPTTGHPDLPIEALVARAKAAGVPDLDRFRRDTLSGRHAADIAEDTAPAKQFGIIGVPAFVIDGEPIIGVRPLEVYTGIIDEHLSAR
ncbi:putative thiol-disulfide oxidoreductase [Gordonia hirsuta DSM 44140 = NBRC 16056]|uniref:Putative thiol-disulfide oxidoreductase n=1 Tax=Gordonia hirsuta DSM 44140 = NBRC 16056 TaxID=1121927 RepID=L7L7Y4_9ACTN|nr:thioredoxin domain-containing protein [Gordonia hirsuta]GAC56162.1 putative thiol-disulfide oxidoreductase [Gordonia hirsuta DSM 44140 = NBRC 16056]